MTLSPVRHMSGRFFFSERDNERTRPAKTRDGSEGSAVEDGVGVVHARTDARRTSLDQCECERP